MPALVASVLETAQCVIPNSVDAELSKHGHDAVERSPHRSSGVDHGLGEGHNIQVALVELVQHFNHQSLAARETIQPPHHDRVPRTCIVEACNPLRPVRDAAGFTTIHEHTAATGFDQFSLLRFRVLFSS